MPLDRLRQKLTKEVMWLYILKLLQERPMYGYEIKDQIKNHFNWSPTTITSYVVLYKLESGGYVRTEVRGDDSTKVKRKYYIITESGETLIGEGIAFLREVLGKLET